MKPLHTSSQVTASDSRMVVRVGELSTPDGPVRRIVVEVNAEMDTTEARWLRDKLDLAITLAEEGDARPDCQDCDCRQWTWNGRSHLLRSDPPSACVCGHETVRHHSEGLPVSEDQPKPREPRVFPKGSPEPEGVDLVEDEHGARWKRAGRPTWAKLHYWRRADLGVMGTLVPWPRLNRRPLSEVLADSEQATR